MEIELTKTELSYFIANLVGEIYIFKRSVEMYKKQKALDSLNSNFYQYHIESNERLINKYSPTLDKLKKALEENHNDIS